MVVSVENLSERMYTKYGMSKLYKSGYIGWLKPCTFTCSIHGDFDGVPKRVYEGKSNCQKCMKKLGSTKSSFRSKGLTYGCGVFDLDMNLFDEPKRYKKIKNLWIDMLERCYSDSERLKAYRGCTVSEDWLYCSNFFEDIRRFHNYEKLHEGWHLDKDIINKGNKIYSKDTCCVVPNDVNSMFAKSKRSRGIYPIGVSYDKKKRSLLATCQVNGKHYFLGYHTSEIEAFNAYKLYKEEVIVKKAIELRNILGERVYQAMLNYEVEITD